MHVNKKAFLFLGRFKSKINIKCQKTVLLFVS